MNMAIFWGLLMGAVILALLAEFFLDKDKFALSAICIIATAICFIKWVELCINAAMNMP